jgi:hypothetical protein
VTDTATKWQIGKEEKSEAHSFFSLRGLAGARQYSNFPQMVPRLTLEHYP